MTRLTCIRIPKLAARHAARYGWCMPRTKLTAFALILSTGSAHAASLDGAAMSLAWALPFAGLLLTIATGPTLFRKSGTRIMARSRSPGRCSCSCRLASRYGGSAPAEALVHALLGEYLSFIVVLFALYTVAGGILVTGNLRGTPASNTAILAFGTAIASVVGTTGAAMILIRPVIAANVARTHRVHVIVFFIILVANVGGALSPLGDPPLFVGFLRGVDFFWPAQHLWLQTTIVAGLLLAMFFALDTWLVARAKRRVPRDAADVAAGPRQDQFRADRADHRGDPAVGGVEAGHRLRHPRHSARDCRTSRATRR